MTVMSVKCRLFTATHYREEVNQTAQVKTPVWVDSRRACFKNEATDSRQLALLSIKTLEKEEAASQNLARELKKIRLPARHVTF